MKAGTIAVVVVGLALVGGGIYLAMQNSQAPQRSETTERTEDLANGSATNPLSAILGTIGTVAGVVRDIRAGDQRTEQLRAGDRTSGVNQRSANVGAYFGGA